MFAFVQQDSYFFLFSWPLADLPQLPRSRLEVLFQLDLSISGLIPMRNAGFR